MIVLLNAIVDYTRQLIKCIVIFRYKYMYALIQVQCRNVHFFDCIMFDIELKKEAIVDSFAFGSNGLLILGFIITSGDMRP